eukprot:CAMPEP_0114246736 /NCGR_PEP_ID=MMETSP0058-20121206/12638_1 /TAXON_ID=36894 /ORGANISM="Pyramimonas parkeae, CCMP726" /LENGTH=186 /DNA_ID=CAMNT_0001359975 /DNA_START=121 /DNA_END=682 /DNA_ORIENTATION=-
MPTSFSLHYGLTCTKSFSRFPTFRVAKTNFRRTVEVRGDLYKCGSCGNEFNVGRVNRGLKCTKCGLKDANRFAVPTVAPGAPGKASWTASSARARVWLRKKHGSGKGSSQSWWWFQRASVPSAQERGARHAQVAKAKAKSFTETQTGDDKILCCKRNHRKEMDHRVEHLHIQVERTQQSICTCQLL